MTNIFLFFILLFLSSLIYYQFNFVCIKIPAVRFNFYLRGHGNEKGRRHPVDLSFQGIGRPAYKIGDALCRSVFQSIYIDDGLPAVFEVHRDLPGVFIFLWLVDENLRFPVVHADNFALFLFPGTYALPRPCLNRLLITAFAVCGGWCFLKSDCV